MQNNDTHIQNLINKAKREEPVIPKEFARTLLEKQALQASAMSHINKGTKMLNSISIASLAASVALLMNTISTSHINKNEVSKIKEQNPKEQIIVQKNDVAKASNVKSDKKSGDSYLIVSDENANIHNNSNSLAGIQADKTLLPKVQVIESNNDLDVSASLPNSKEVIVCNNNEHPETAIVDIYGNPINNNGTSNESITGINSIKLSISEINKLGIDVHDCAKVDFYSKIINNESEVSKTTISVNPISITKNYIPESDIPKNIDVPTKQFNYKVISNQDGIKILTTHNVAEIMKKELIYKPMYQNQDKQYLEEIIIKKSFLNRNHIYWTTYLQGIGTKSQIIDIKDEGKYIHLYMYLEAESPDYSTIYAESKNLNLTKANSKNTFFNSDSTKLFKHVEGIVKKIYEASILEERNFQQFNSNIIGNTSDIELNELLPIEIELKDHNHNPLFIDNKLQTLIFWFEPTKELISYLPEYYRLKIANELQAIPNDYETCPAPPVTGGQPHFDVWRACSGAIENLKTYPTPVEDVLHFKYNLSEGRQISMYVCNLNGEVIANPIKYEKYHKGCVEDQINVGYLNSGMYLLVISTDTGEQAVQRFLVR